MSDDVPTCEECGAALVAFNTQYTTTRGELPKGYTPQPVQYRCPNGHGLTVPTTPAA